jgi:hypothetical protein
MAFILVTQLYCFFQYLGNWYQAEGIPAFFQPSSTTCIRATYGDMGK